MNVQQLQKRADAKRKMRDEGRAERAALTGDGSPNPSTDFDVSKASVAAVLAHVQLHPDLRKSVLAAERKGRKRKGIIDALKGS